MLTLVEGNLFVSRAQTLVNTVNCCGVMGKGIALEFKRRYPAMFEDYRRRCDSGLVAIGRPYVYPASDGRLIINFPTKRHWRGQSQLEYIGKGLDCFVASYAEWGVTSVAFPALGCNNGGLDWSDVGSLMVDKLGQLPISIELYKPSVT